MAHATPCRRARQAAACRQRLHQAPGLPLATALPPQRIHEALTAEQVTFRDRLFSPLITIWVFVCQCLDPDHCCQAAVDRFLAWRAAQGRSACSSDTSAYCKARARLPEGVLSRLTRQSGQEVQDQAPPAWRWNGRTIKVVDGTTVSMPDTPANQQAYPQARTQRSGVGFPISRLVVLFSLAVGTVLDAAQGPYRGKQTGETALFHALLHNLDTGDILLADRYFGSYWEMAQTQQRGADLVCRLHQRRRADFRRGRRLGVDDHVVTWDKPPRPEWLDEATYAALPAQLEVREVRVHVQQPGFRTRLLVVATTLLEADVFPRADLAVLYRLRWYAELDLRSLKQTLQMDVLRCKSPDLVRKEVWAHLLAYNVLRGVMADAARAADLLPVQVSFKGTVQAVNAFAAALWTAGPEELAEIVRRLQKVVVRNRVGDRPNRYEPRRRKRRPKPYPLLNEPRPKARRRLAGRRCA